jgi:hypothetical protein
MSHGLDYTIAYTKGVSLLQQYLAFQNQRSNYTSMHGNQSRSPDGKYPTAWQCNIVVCSHFVDSHQHALYIYIYIYIYSEHVMKPLLYSRGIGQVGSMSYRAAALTQTSYYFCQCMVCFLCVCLFSLMSYVVFIMYTVMFRQVHGSSSDSSCALRCYSGRECECVLIYKHIDTHKNRTLFPTVPVRAF